MGLYQPYIQAGTDSLQGIQDIANSKQLTSQFSFNPTDLQSDPGYAFTLKQGQDALQRSAAAQGGLYSSGTQKSLAGYTEGTANQYFGDAYNRALSTFQANQQQALNRASTLQGLAGMGLTGAGGASSALGTNAGLQSGNITGAADLGAQLGLSGATTGAGLATQSADLGLRGATAQGNFITGAGNAQAAGTAGQTNNWAGALDGVNNSIRQFLAKRGSSGTNGVGSGGFGTLTTQD